MFGYLSMLVEAKIFNTIYINFMIVGHTHSTIDQYFSVFSTCIKGKAFIASSLSLEELLKTAHKGESINKRPSFVKKLSVYYNYKAFLQPYLNTTIKVFFYKFIIKKKYKKD
jgi:hypothetical protein